MPLTPQVPRQSIPARQSDIPEVGNIAPSLKAKTGNGGEFDLQDDDAAGHFVFLLFSPDLGAAGRAFQAHGESLAAMKAIFAIVGPRGNNIDAIRVLPDPNGDIARIFGMTGGGLVVTGPNQHIAWISREGGLESQLNGALETLMPRVLHRGRGSAPAHPPVLMVPDVLSPKDCQRLITIYRTDGHQMVEPGHQADAPVHDYKMRIPDYGRQDRIDHWINNRDTNSWLDGRLSARLFPEIKKAFHYTVTRRENYRIGCYEGARGGEKKGHRDNTEPLVAHRRFACSINLNTPDFEGGEIKYPEFGDFGYRPGIGEAVVFSSSLLHEVMGVTKGRRYVLLAFLFGDS